jgi:hypothetical protein
MENLLELAQSAMELAAIACNLVLGSAVDQDR